jgi:DNA modification methylase
VTAAWRILVGDVLERLDDLEAGTVQTVVTSPPYWGLRDYGTATWDGGDAGCDHRVYGHAPGKATPGGRGGSMPMQEVVQRETCGKCGARRIDSQLGLEPTPEEYVANMVEVFREVRRVLRDDGTVWLNLGDSYASGEVGRHDRADGYEGDFSRASTQGQRHQRRLRTGLKPKDLVGIPWRVAFALQADGWYLRSDIIWSKPNPMPESVTDRPTKAHEYVFLLSKQARYYFDADAVRESSTERPSGNVERFVAAHGERSRLNTHLGSSVPYQPDGSGRNIRSVWNIATEPFPGAHFATFPKKLVEPCIKAGSATGDTVLDPFAGSGTVGVVALRLGRSFLGVELNPAYAEMARERIRGDAPLFNVQTEVPTIDSARLA